MLIKIRVIFFLISKTYFPESCTEMSSDTSVLSKYLRMRLKLTILFLSVFIIGTCFGQDRYFARTYQTTVLSKGNIDIEFWHTSRLGHKNEFFHGQDQRIELEFGLGKNVQTAFYFNRFQKTAIDSSGNNITSNEIGFSNEWKWKLSDPINNTIGIALYGEIGWKGDELELETKLILDKQIGKNLFAFNLVAEFEQEIKRQGGKTEIELEETPIELDFAYMRNLSVKWGIGLEVVNHNDIGKDKGWENSVWYAGPSLNYRGNRWFVIANFLPQLFNGRRTIYSPDKRVLDEHEKFEGRLIFGISL